MNVKELIEFLETMDPELQVAYKCFSEQVLLKTDELEIKSLCAPRADGWIQNGRPDKDEQLYLVFPGN